MVIWYTKMITEFLRQHNEDKRIYGHYGDHGQGEDNKVNDM
jgi:hypothetical protein